MSVVPTHDLPSIARGSSYTFAGPRLYGSRGAGITTAQQQRAARKARNVKRHKAASRGRA